MLIKFKYPTLSQFHFILCIGLCAILGSCDCQLIKCLKIVEISGNLRKPGNPNPGNSIDGNWKSKYKSCEITFICPDMLNPMRVATH